MKNSRSIGIQGKRKRVRERERYKYMGKRRHRSVLERWQSAGIWKAKGHRDGLEGAIGGQRENRCRTGS